jgi:hypothetical protein
MAPAKIIASPSKTWPFGFHASFLNISEGPIVFLPIASAVEASTAALEVFLLIPPEPRRKQAPARMNNIPSIAEKSESGCKRKSQKLTAYVPNANTREDAIKRTALRRLYLLMLLKSKDAMPRIKGVARGNLKNELRAKQMLYGEKTSRFCRECLRRIRNARLTTNYW